VLRIFLTNICI